MTQNSKTKTLITLTVLKESHIKWLNICAYFSHYSMSLYRGHI